MGAERLVANNPRRLDVDTLEHIVRAAHAGDRAALREARAEASSADHGARAATR
jgi:alcohol dehydrogenase